MVLLKLQHDYIYDILLYQLAREVEIKVLKILALVR